MQAESSYSHKLVLLLTKHCIRVHISFRKTEEGPELPKSMLCAFFEINGSVLCKCYYKVKL